jgi:RNA polymerase sigma-70 factor (ECF subfamily)
MAFMTNGIPNEASLSLDEIIGKYHPMLLAFVRGRIAVAHEAEDVVQETWLRSFAVISSGTVLNVKAYLHRAVRNLMIDRLRSEERMIVSSDEEALMTARDLRVDVERELLVRDALRRIELALQGMPAKSRDVFVLARIEGMSYADIGRKLGITRQTVREHMMRAMLLLESEIASLR